MALNPKTRCDVCSRYFCCARHRKDHQVKNHADVCRKQGQDFVQFFQRKAETIMLKSKNHQAKVKREGRKRSVQNCDTNVPSKISNNNDVDVCSFEQLHGETKNWIVSESLATVSQRKILLPSYRLRHRRLLKSDGVYRSRSSTTDEHKRSALDVNGHIVKTSTPIVNTLSIQSSAQSTWDNISPASSISGCQSPVDQPELTKVLAEVTPLQGIMAKVSRYQCDSESRPSLGTSSSRSRRVTFSLTGSPPPSAPEVGDIQCLIHSQVLLQSTFRSNEYISILYRDAPPSYNELGFFSCVKSMFCLVVQNIPGFRSWCNVYQKGALKRSRSPEPIGALEEVPVHKKPCFNCDMRENPIKSRKPISGQSLMIDK